MALPVNPLELSVKAVPRGAKFIFASSNAIRFLPYYAKLTKRTSIQDFRDTLH